MAGAGEEDLLAVLIRLLAGVLLIAHGAVHLLYLVPDVEEFTIEESWVVPAGSRRPVAVALMAATVAAYVLLGLAVWGVPLLSGAWSPLTIAASVASLVLLVAYWNPRLIFGVAIDLALIAVAVLRPAWTASLG